MIGVDSYKLKYFKLNVMNNKETKLVKICINSNIPIDVLMNYYFYFIGGHLSLWAAQWE